MDIESAERENDRAIDGLAEARCFPDALLLMPAASLDLVTSLNRTGSPFFSPSRAASNLQRAQALKRFTLEIKDEADAHTRILDRMNSTMGGVQVRIDPNRGQRNRLLPSALRPSNPYAPTLSLPPDFPRTHLPMPRAY